MTRVRFTLNTEKCVLRLRLLIPVGHITVYIFISTAYSFKPFFHGLLLGCGCYWHLFMSHHSFLTINLNYEGKNACQTGKERSFNWCAYALFFFSFSSSSL